jgi:hypothetical protein
MSEEKVNELQSILKQCDINQSSYESAPFDPIMLPHYKKTHIKVLRKNKWVNLNQKKVKVLTNPTTYWRKKIPRVWLGIAVFSLLLFVIAVGIVYG